MTTLALPMASPIKLKRPYSEVELDDGRQDPQGSLSPAMQDSKQPLAQSNMQSGNSILLPSTPGRSKASSPGRDTPGSTAADGPSKIQPAPIASTESARKKRKLTFAEKESKRLEKEAQDRLKAEEKARREVEKRRKEGEIKEQKRKKEEEKEEKRRAKEADKQLREEERAQKEAEKKAKEDEKHKKDKVSTSNHRSPNETHWANAPKVANATQRLLRKTSFACVRYGES